MGIGDELIWAGCELKSRMGKGDEYIGMGELKIINGERGVE